MNAENPFEKDGRLQLSFSRIFSSKLEGNQNAEENFQLQLGKLYNLHNLQLGVCTQ